MKEFTSYLLTEMPHMGQVACPYCNYTISAYDAKVELLPKTTQMKIWSNGEFPVFCPACSKVFRWNLRKHFATKLTNKEQEEEFKLVPKEAVKEIQKVYAASQT